MTGRHKGGPYTIRAWLRGLFGARRIEREMQDEMAEHLARAAERYRARGMSGEEARLAARREFGNVGVVQQEAREGRAGQWLSSLAGDARYALRHFVRTPLTTITVVLTLALGIGFSSAVFSVLDGILRRPAPGVPNDADLVKIRGLTDRAPHTRRLSWPELAAYARLTDRFASVAGWVTGSVVIETDSADERRGRRASAQFVTPGYFATLGVRPAFGRDFGPPPPEGTADLSAIMSEALARQQFGDAERAVGRRVVVNGTPMTIVGVTAPRFHGGIPTGEFRVIWLPLSTWPVVERIGDAMSNLNATRFEAFARLRPGQSAPAVTPHVAVIAGRFDTEARARLPRAWTGTADVVRMRGIDMVTRYSTDLFTGALFSSTIALLILLVCTTTVNSLLVGAATARSHEIGVRLAMGAPRKRIVRQLLTEVAMLATLGGLLGMYAFGALAQLIEVASDGFDVSPDWVTMGFVLVYALATAVLSGLSPALHATRTGVADVLKGGGPGASRKSRLQRVFVVAQIAVAQPLMVALAAVIIDGLDGLPPAEVLPVREQLMMAELDTYVANARGEPDHIPGLMVRLGEIPGVAAVVPVGYAIAPLPLVPPAADSGGAGRLVLTEQNFVPPGYFAAVGARLLQGRDFVWADTLPEVMPAVLSQAVAATLFPAGGAIGQRITSRSRRASVDEQGFVFDDRGAEFAVIGVVGPASETGIVRHESKWPPVFVPLRRSGSALLEIRTRGPAEPLMPAVLAAARAESRLLVVTRLRTLAMGDRERRSERVQLAGALSAMGVVALLLAAVGLYAMVRMAVEQRRREIGIRIALGADARQVVRMFFAGGVRTALLALAIGLPVSIAGVSLTQDRVGDFIGDAAIAGALVMVAVSVVAALASWLPARRAARVDAMIALRSE